MRSGFYCVLTVPKKYGPNKHCEKFVHVFGKHHGLFSDRLGQDRSFAATPAAGLRATWAAAGKHS